MANGTNTIARSRYQYIILYTISTEKYIEYYRRICTLILNSPNIVLILENHENHIINPLNNTSSKSDARKVVLLLWYRVYYGLHTSRGSPLTD